ncbi:MAG: isoprenyl transferase [Ignavibacteriales bacterium]
MVRKKHNPDLIDPNKVPYHIAIIMDGNGRWANKRFMPRHAGHRAGIEALRRALEAVEEFGVSVLTVYAFSTENWKRPQEEVKHLMNLLLEYLANELKTLHEKNVKIRILGDQTGLNPEIRRELTKASKQTENNTKLILNIALNYGGRAEILMAAKRLADDVKAGKMLSEDITEQLFQEYLYTAGLGDPDLLIRTAGELRISNFLLWQIAYSEIWVTDVLWPDFNRDVMMSAIIDYQKRDRKFGDIKIDKKVND